MDSAEIERAVGWDLDTALEARWKDKAVIVADDVFSTQSVAHWSESDHPEGVVVSMWTIYETPSPLDYVDSKIGLNNVKVADKSERGAFVGLGGAPSLFVVPNDGGQASALTEGQRVDVVGTLKALPAPPQAKQRWKLSEEQSTRLATAALYVEASKLVPVEDTSTAQK